MRELDADVDAWADALGGSTASDRSRTAGDAEILVERRTGAEARRVVEVRIRTPAGGVSSVALSPAEARTLAGRLAAAAGDPDAEGTELDPDTRSVEDA